MEETLPDRVDREAPNLPPSLKAIAEFLSIEGTGLEDVGMTQLALLTYTSKPTIVRFAQHFGYKGWKDFKADYLCGAREREQKALLPSSIDPNYPFGTHDSPATIVERIAMLHAGTAKRVLGALSLERLERGARAVLSAHKVLVLGNPPNQYYGQVFAFNVSNLGVDCRVPHSETTEQEVRLLGEGDLIIAISYSGNLVRGTLKYVEPAKHCGAKIVGITSCGSPLSDLCDIALCYEPLEHYYSKIAGYYGCECVSIILDELHALCFAANYEKNNAERQTNAATWRQRFGTPDDL